ncbi:pilus assembly protein CpaC [Neorhodopirellula lusitana]|uniref:Pilus assembly protein CpaC n=1 Tax=Neorhodopirellula lusitana TaxID=445327 RepID=A0ABY1Q1H8_9BACT|nr:pilus assembly protein N-terminal domain-containing protein [Neorhodopirellula lusitana]SMP54026.1 pilus assembly protein CpaC [Neorhodopirellula lusitana]
MRARFSYTYFRFVVAVLAVMGHGLFTSYGVSSVAAQSSAALASVAGDHKIANTVERMELIVKSSRILSLGDRIPRFQVHNEEVLGATPVSENQIQIFAKNPGSTQVNLWDTEDKLYTIDVTIVADAREVEGILNSQLPLASLKVTPINESAIVSGYVTSVDDVDRAVAIIEQFYKVVINNIEVVGVQQVLLHTRIMEVSRTKLRQLGIDWSLQGGDYAILNGPGELLDVPGGLVEGVDDAFGYAPFGGATNLRVGIGNQFEAFVEALDEQKLVKLLAEPTVVATHGRPARFTVGGRVPNVIPGSNGQLQVSYEDYGTSIDFLPFVVGPGRIRLEVRPEVSEPDPSRAVTINNTNVQAFTARYVETAVEMQAGQTFALAGLLQSRVDSVIKRTPFLGHLPYIGAFFRNTQDQRNEIELLIMVTPELVEAMDPHEVPVGGPGMNSDMPDEHEFYINGHIEVPNLKGDNCNEQRSDYCPSEASYQGGEVLMDSNVVMPGGVSQSGTAPSGSQALASRTANVARNPNAAPNAGTRIANVNHQQPTSQGRPTYPQASRASGNYNSSGIESGTLLPSGAVTPGSDPMVVGEGVTVTQPAYR